jgi:hypothetical protein
MSYDTKFFFHRGYPVAIFKNRNNSIDSAGCMDLSQVGNLYGFHGEFRSALATLRVLAAGNYALAVDSAFWGILNDRQRIAILDHEVGHAVYQHGVCDPCSELGIFQEVQADAYSIYTCGNSPKDLIDSLELLIDSRIKSNAIWLNFLKMPDRIPDMTEAMRQSFETGHKSRLDILRAA